MSVYNSRGIRKMNLFSKKHILFNTEIIFFYSFLSFNWPTLKYVPIKTKGEQKNVQIFCFILIEH